MDSIFELLRVSLQPLNLPFSILLGLVVLYWLFVCLGFFSTDGLDGDMEMSGDADGLHSFGSLHSVLKFLHVGEAPLMAILSILVVCAWAFSVLANYYFNPGGAFGFGLLLLIPNLLVSLVLTRFLTKPLRVVFKLLSKDYDRHEKIVGQVCLITTGEVTERFGQGTVEIKGAPLVLQVRTSHGEILRRGDRGLIISEDKEKSCFHIIKYQEPKLEERI
jgi:hypothetical protein